MNSELRELIAELRTDLVADQPATLVWAQINDGAPAERLPAGLPQPIRELLAVADGILAGAFDLSGAADLDELQYFLEMMPEFTRVADEPEKWLVFGRLHDEPLLIHRETGAVWYFPDTDGDEWFMREEFEGVATDLDAFLSYYVFGAGYAEIGFEDDEWWGFLDEHDLTGDDEDEESAR